MECETCQSRFSDLIDRLLIPREEAELRRHLEGCAPCQGELRRLRGAVAALRAAPALEPPPGLLESVLASLPAVSDGPAVIVPSLRRWAWIGAAAAAILLFAGLAGLLFVREGDRDADFRKLQGQVSALEVDRAALRREIADSRKAFGGEQGKLRADLEKTNRLLEESRAARIEDARRGEERAAALKSEVARLAGEKARIETEEIPSLRAKLARAEEDAAKARAALALAERKAQRPEVAAGAAPEAALAARAPARSPVAFRRRGGDLTIEIKGPRSVIIPQLLLIASSEEEGEESRLAMNALEDLLGAGAGDVAQASPPAGGADGGPPGIAGWFNRSVKRIAGEVELAGGESARAESPPGEESARRERLRLLEEKWRILSEAENGK